MALQTSGPIALFLEIRAEEIVKTPSLSATDFGLREVSAAAGFTEPDLMSEFYGYSSVTPIVWTAAPVEVSKNDISINVRQNANTYNQGNGTITSKGFYYGTSTNIASATKVQVNTSNNTAEFSRNFTGLSGGTTYRFWAYAVNDVGETVSPRRDIATLPSVSITTIDSYNSTYNIYGAAMQPSNMSITSWGNFYARTGYNHPYYGWTYPDSANTSVQSCWQNGNRSGSFTARSRKANNATTSNRRQMGISAWTRGEVYGQGLYVSDWNPYDFRMGMTYWNMQNISQSAAGNGCGTGFKSYGSYYNNGNSCITMQNADYYDHYWYMSGGGQNYGYATGWNASAHHEWSASYTVTYNKV